MTANRTLPRFALRNKAYRRLSAKRWAETIWHGFEKTREPLEVFPAPGLNPGDALSGNTVSLAKGYTRVSILVYAMAQTLMVEDLTDVDDSEKDFFTKLLGPLHS